MILVWVSILTLNRGRWPIAWYAEDCNLYLPKLSFHSPLGRYEELLTKNNISFAEDVESTRERSANRALKPIQPASVEVCVQRIEHTVGSEENEALWLGSVRGSNLNVLSLWNLCAVHKTKIALPNSSGEVNVYLRFHALSDRAHAHTWKNTPVTSHGYWWLTSRKWIVAYLIDLSQRNESLRNKI